MTHSSYAGDDEAHDTNDLNVDEYSAIDPFNEPGWVVEPLPDIVLACLGQHFKHKKVAHHFLTGEWLIGTYVKRCRRGKHKGEHEVMFRVDMKPETWYMELNESDYGTNKIWCFVAKHI